MVSWLMLSISKCDLTKWTSIKTLSGNYSKNNQPTVWQIHMDLKLLKPK